MTVCLAGCLCLTSHSSDGDSIADRRVGLVDVLASIVLKIVENIEFTCLTLEIPRYFDQYKYPMG